MWKAQEAYLKQKSRNKWLNLGDHNNAYFHKMVKASDAKNKIRFNQKKKKNRRLWSEDGRKVEDIEEIKSVVEENYKKLIGSSKLLEVNGDKEHFVLSE
jgi:phosphorylcholine metabolism protein LicD